MYLGEKLPLHLMGHAQVQYKDSFLLVGGRGGSNSSSKAPSKQIYEYDAAHGNWTLWSTSLSTQDTSLVSALIIRDPCNNCSSAKEDNIGNVGTHYQYHCPRVVDNWFYGLNRRMPLSHGNQTSTRILKVFQNLRPRGTDESRLDQLLVCLAYEVLSVFQFGTGIVVLGVLFPIFVITLISIFLIFPAILALFGITIVGPYYVASQIAAFLMIVLGLKIGRHTQYQAVLQKH